jgi:hypothetical protein
MGVVLCAAMLSRVLQGIPIRTPRQGPPYLYDADQLHGLAPERESSCQIKDLDYQSGFNEAKNRPCPQNVHLGSY